MSKKVVTVIGTSYDSDEDVLAIDTDSNETDIEIDDASLFAEEFLAEWPAIKESSEVGTYGGVAVSYDKESNTLTLLGVSNFDADEFAGIIEDNYELI